MNSAYADLHGAKQRAALSQLTAQHANIIAALALLTDRDLDEDETLFVARLRNYWRDRGLAPEGGQWVRRLLTTTTRQLNRAYLLASIALLEFDYGDITATEAPALEAESIFQAADHRPGLAEILSMRGLIALRRDNAATAIPLLKQPARIWSEIEKDGLKGQDSAYEKTIDTTANFAISLVNLGNAYFAGGDYEAARRLFQTSTNLFRGLEDERSTLLSMLNKARAEHALGRIGAAKALVEETKRISRESGDTMIYGFALHAEALIDYAQGDYSTSLDLARQSLDFLGNFEQGFEYIDGLELVAAALAGLGQLESALAVYGIADGLRDRYVATASRAQRERRESALDSIRERIAPSNFDYAQTLGRLMAERTNTLVMVSAELASILG